MSSDTLLKLNLRINVLLLSMHKQVHRLSKICISMLNIFKHFQSRNNFNTHARPRLRFSCDNNREEDHKNVGTSGPKFY